MLQKFQVQCTYCVCTAQQILFLTCCRIQIRWGEGKDILSRILVFWGSKKITNGIVHCNASKKNLQYHVLTIKGNLLSIIKCKKYFLEM